MFKLHCFSFWLTFQPVPATMVEPFLALLIMMSLFLGTVEPYVQLE